MKNRYGILVITVLAVTLLSGCKARFVPMDMQDAGLAWLKLPVHTMRLSASLPVPLTAWFPGSGPGLLLSVRKDEGGR